MTNHQARVDDIARQVMARPAGAKLTIRKTTPTHSIRDQAYKSGLHAVDVGALDQIIEIDAERRLARVEGQVTIGELAEATLAKGLLPAVVPEYRKFTVSGLINGEGIQSSAHRHGVFTHTVRSIEMVVADGRVLRASPDDHTDLFYAAAESLGTLGVVTEATIALVPVRPYVRCTYRRFTSLAEYVKAFEAALGATDFHEGIIFGPRGYVLATGEFIETPDGLPIFDPERPGGEYYHQHVRTCADKCAVTVEAMATLKYLHRLERGLWWALEDHADFPLLSETEWGRRHLDAEAAKVYSKSGFTSQAITAGERDRCQVNQDMGVAIEQLQEGIEWVQSRLRVYPLWNCAVKVPDREVDHFGTRFIVDIGIYGEPKVSDYRNVRDMRALQQRVPAPSLWGVSYLAWDEIRAKNPERFDRYERARRQTNAGDAFLHIKDKVVWIDPAAADPGTIKSWRLRRAFGPRWHLNPLVYLVLGAVFLSKLAWRPRSITR